MKNLIKRFGWYNVTVFIVMILGVLLYGLTPALIRLFNFDSDIIGVMVFGVGLLAWGIGLVIRLIMKVVKKSS
jgi:hypothetical protein